MTTGQAATDAFAFLIDNLPPRVAWSRPRVAIPRCRCSTPPRARRTGRSRRCRPRFNDAEAAAFFETSLGLDLQAAQIQALASRTRWSGRTPARRGVGPGSCGRGRTPSSAFIRAFSGTHRFVLDYLVQEVLDAQPLDTRTFLLLTSVLDRLSGPLRCSHRRAGRAAATGPSGRANVFLIALDDRGWYRYHALFAEAVRGRLAAERPDAVAGLHRRAAAVRDPGAARRRVAACGPGGRPGLVRRPSGMRRPVFRRERRRDRC